MSDSRSAAEAPKAAGTRANLRPVFVGVDRELIRAAIDGEPKAVRVRLTQSVHPDDFARPDRAGGWIVPLGEGRHIVGGT